MKRVLHKLFSLYSPKVLKANSDAAVRLQTWRHDTFIMLLKIFSVLSACAVVVQYFLLTYHPSRWEHLIVWGSSLTLLLIAFIEGLPFKLKAWVFVLLLYTITTKQLFVVGLMSSAPVFPFIIPIAVHLLFGRKSGLWAVVTSVSLMLVAIFMIFVKILPLDTFKATEPFNTQRWAEVGISLCGRMLILLIILDRYGKLMKTLVLESQQKAEERELLIQEIHHRVKNNLQIVLSLLNMQISETEIEEVRLQLAGSQLRINSMALVYEQLYEANDVQYIDAKKYLTAVIMDTTSSFNSREVPIQLNVRAENIFIQMGMASPLGLALVELVGVRINSCMHRIDDITIFLEIVQRDSEIELLYRDNGDGESGIECLERKKSLSKELIETLIYQLSGSISYSIEDGFICQMRIPL